jgi:hypothetical protein
MLYAPTRHVIAMHFTKASHEPPVTPRERASHHRQVTQSKIASHYLLVTHGQQASHTQQVTHRGKRAMCVKQPRECQRAIH